MCNRFTEGRLRLRELFAQVFIHRHLAGEKLWAGKDAHYGLGERYEISFRQQNLRTAPRSPRTTTTLPVLKRKRNAFLFGIRKLTPGNWSGVDTCSLFPLPFRICRRTYIIVSYIKIGQIKERTSLDRIRMSMTNHGHQDKKKILGQTTKKQGESVDVFSKEKEVSRQE